MFITLAQELLHHLSTWRNWCPKLFLVPRYYRWTDQSIGSSFKTGITSVTSAKSPILWTGAPGQYLKKEFPGLWIIIKNIGKNIGNGDMVFIFDHFHIVLYSTA